MISTNKVKPKENHKWDRFLEETKDDKGEPTGNIISHIPQKVIASSQESFKERRLPIFPISFPGIHKVEQRKPERTFMQSQDLRDIETQKRQAKTAAVKAVQKANPRTRKGGRRKKG